jgi:hypothetical protein
MMTPEQQENWMDKTITAVGGAAVLSQASSREVARHALTALFCMTNNDSAASLAVVQKISDFPVRRRLLEVFRRSYVEVSAPFTSPIFFQQGSFSNLDFADAFDRDLLLLWRQAEGDRARFDALVANYPNAARVRITKRLTSQAFLRKRRIRYAVRGVFSSSGTSTSPIINILVILIFIMLIVVIFDQYV